MHVCPGVCVVSVRACVHLNASVLCVRAFCMRGRHFLGMRAIETGYYNWLSKYCPDPHISCADGYSLWRRYLVSL